MKKLVVAAGAALYVGAGYALFDSSPTQVGFQKVFLGLSATNTAAPYAKDCLFMLSRDIKTVKGANMKVYFVGSDSIMHP